MGTIFTLIQIALGLVGLITVIVLAIGAWNGHVIRKIQELRHKREDYIASPNVYYDLKRQEDQLVNLITSDSVKRFLVENDSAMIDSVLHDHSVEVLGMTFIMVVGGRFQHEKVFKPDGSFGIRTTLESKGILGVLMSWIKQAILSIKKLWKTLRTR
jgi:hypothetical protein